MKAVFIASTFRDSDGDLIVDAMATPLDDMVEIVPVGDACDDAMPSIVLSTENMVEIIELMIDCFSGEQIAEIKSLMDRRIND